jgi:hypothetical protein
MHRPERDGDAPAMRRQVALDKLPEETDIHSESEGAATWGEGDGILSQRAVFSSERCFLPPL